MCKTERIKVRIFGKKKESEPPQLQLVPSKNKISYDIKAALLKAVLVFMLSFGAVGGFLSAYEMEYNRNLCMAGLLVMSVVLSLLYEIKVKFITNQGILLIFALYVYVAVKHFWELNSGAYAIINKMYSVARIYLRLDAGTEYNLRVDDLHLAVTSIALFVGVVLVIFLTIRLQYRTTVWWAFLLTFSLFLIPLYFEKAPDDLCTFFMLAAYITIFILQRSGAGKQTSQQVKHALPIGALIALVVVLLLNVFVPRRSFRLLAGNNPQKTATETTAANFAQYGLMAFFQRAGTGSGISGGVLSRGGMVLSDYQTDLIVRYAPFDYSPMYLKAFTGMAYLGDRWEAAPKDGSLAAQAAAREELYREHPDRQGRGRMEVENVGAASRFEYQPYYTDLASKVIIGEKAFYTFYPPITGAPIGAGVAAAEEGYLEVPSSCYNAVKTICDEEGFSKDPVKAALEIVAFFDENYNYTLRPGFLLGSTDYISYFLLQNKKGYCMHFASAATMLFRYLGIPARYAEGYAFSYTDMILDGKLLEEDYGEYYDGYSELGETGVIEVEVSDNQAHAWVEIYLEEYGWVVIDPTPAASEEEDVGDFWSNFLNRGGSGNGAGGEDGDLPTYLEQALSGGAWLGIALLAVLGAAFLGRRGVRAYRESKLPMADRARLEYRRLVKYLGGKFPDFAKLPTPEEQIRWMESCKGIQIEEGFKNRVYGLFFAPDWAKAPEGLLEEIRVLHKNLRRYYGR